MITSKARKIEVIRSKLVRFVTEISLENRRNLTDINIEAEDLFCTLLNMIWMTKLKNANRENSYSPGIDLYDKDKLIFVQVSSDGSKKKVENSLATCSKYYKSCHFRFLCLKDNKKLSKDIDVPFGIEFNSQDDFYDICKIIKEIESKDYNVINGIYDFLMNELYPEDTGKMTTELGEIVKILAKKPKINSEKTILFAPEIHDKIVYNDLDELQNEIEEWSSFCGILKQVYRQFPISVETIVQSRIFRSYILSKNKGKISIELFYSIVDDLVGFIQKEGTLKNISREELEYDLSIIITDVFMECRIFDKPQLKEESDGITG